MTQILSVASKRIDLDAQRLTPLLTGHSTLMLIKNFTEQKPQHTPSVYKLLKKELSRNNYIVLKFLKNIKLNNKSARPFDIYEINETNEFLLKYLFPKIIKLALFSFIVTFKTSKNRTLKSLFL